jgi:hypothetical protein
MNVNRLNSWFKCKYPSVFSVSQCSVYKSKLYTIIFKRVIKDLHKSQIYSHEYHKLLIAQTFYSYAFGVILKYIFTFQMERFVNNLEENNEILGNYLVNLGERIKDKASTDVEALKASMFFISMHDIPDTISTEELAIMALFISSQLTSKI